MPFCACRDTQCVDSANTRFGSLCCCFLELLTGALYRHRSLSVTPADALYKPATSTPANTAPSHLCHGHRAGAHAWRCNGVGLWPLPQGGGTLPARWAVRSAARQLESASCRGTLPVPAPGAWGGEGRLRSRRGGGGPRWALALPLPSIPPRCKRVTTAPSAMALASRTATWWARLRNPCPCAARLCLPPWLPEGPAACQRLYSSPGKVSPQGCGGTFRQPELDCSEFPKAGGEPSCRRDLSRQAVSPWRWGRLRACGRRKTCRSKLRHPARDTAGSAV